MSGRRGRVSLVVAVVAGLLAVAAPGAGASARVSVMVDHARISTELGHTFVFRSTITNAGPTVASGLIAHLNVLSFHNGVYVDPEDWSSHRTRYLPPIPANGSATITWRMEAVNSGSFAVYVAVLPQGGAPDRPTTGPAIRVAVAERRTLNSGGILPLALGIPASLALVWAAFWLRRSRPRRS
jgi:hypothetical protein